jgi:urease accessory protein
MTDLSHQVKHYIMRGSLALLLLGAPQMALAHSNVGGALSFVTGFLHPFTGIDHLLAMLAVGIWGAQLGGAALWMLPVSFPLIMALGAVAGILGLPMLATEPGIAASVIMLGFAIASNLRLPVLGATAFVGIFAIFHGYAHGAELPKEADVLPYCAGFVLATGLIHLMGIAVGMLSRRLGSPLLLRAGGALIAGVGVLLEARLMLAPL